MTPDQQQQVERVCLALLDAPVADRPQMLDELCQDDPTVRREVEALLAGQDAAGVLLRTPVPGAARAVLQAAALSSLVGRTLGPYQIEAPLGAGGMGQVYRAHDGKLGREVALKVLPPDVAADPDRLSRFEREARLLAGLSHPAILTIHDVGVHDDVPYVVTELLEGESLREVLTRRQPTWQQALGMALQAAQGVAAAHRKGIVHRDLKPENLFLTNDGRLKILDFGLAKRTPMSPPLAGEPSDTSTLPGLLVGTVAYMAPEQLDGRRVDARADVFAFGIVLYELLTRRHPFRRGTPASTMDAILHESPPPPVALVPALPAGISGIVQRCLAKAREDRYPDGDALAQALLAVAQVSREAASEQSLRELVDATREPAGRASPPDVRDDRRDAADDVAHHPPSTAQARSDAPSGPLRRPVRWRRWLGVVSAAVAAAIIGAAGALWLSPTGGPAPVVRSDLSVRPAETLNAGGVTQGPTTTPGGTRTALRWTPDGAALVFVGRRGDVQQLFVRALDAGEAQPLAGTEGASVPAVSVDGQWVAFWASHAIRKVSLSGGPVVELERLDLPPTGLVWDQQGGLVFSVTHDSIQRVGAGTPLTTLGATERSHVVSALLPDERTVLFTVRKRNFTWGGEVVEALDLPTGRRKEVLRDAVDARYVPTGHLVFLRDNVLHAAQFDLGAVEVTGAPTPILRNISQALSGGLAGDVTGALGSTTSPPPEPWPSSPAASSGPPPGPS
jgi:serine/threonine protein kinase